MKGDRFTGVINNVLILHGGGELLFAFGRFDGGAPGQWRCGEKRNS